jgi:hypothetical protein|tara:strand:+ start:77 stop:316 length:240 start_codon:yes stop_codon:yes gene_type:complete
MARLLKSNGEILPNVDISSLKKMQDLVQGYIEFIYIKNKILIVNEEGLLDQLPPNIEASRIYGKPLVGDVVECGIKEVN